MIINYSLKSHSNFSYTEASSGDSSLSYYEICGVAEGKCQAYIGGRSYSSASGKSADSVAFCNRKF